MTDHLGIYLNNLQRNEMTPVNVEKSFRIIRFKYELQSVKLFNQ